MTTTSTKSMENRVRRLAKRLELRAMKSRRDGTWSVIDPYRNFHLHGGMDAESALEWLADYEKLPEA